MRFAPVLFVSCALGLTACAALPPCNREDVQQAYDAQGKPRKDALAITNACFDRMVGDLDVCYKDAR